MNQNFFWGVIIFTLSCSSAIAAKKEEDHSGFYVGTSLGTSGYRIEVEEDDFDTDKGMTFRLRGGYRFNNHFALEVHYNNLGEGEESTTDVTDTSVETVDITFEGSAFSFAAVNTIPLGMGFELQGKLGIDFWQIDYTFDNVYIDDNPDLSFTERDTEDFSGADLFAMVGVSYRATQNLYVVLNYEYHKWEDDFDDNVDIDFGVDAVTLGVNWVF